MAGTKKVASTGGSPAAERRAAEAALRELVAKHAPAHERLVAATRRSLRKRLPTAHEVVYEYANALVISVSPSDHGYQGVFAIRASTDDTRLYFNQGKGLPDPEKRLRGNAQARWIPLAGAATLAEPAVAALIGEAIARNRVAFAKTGSGAVVIRSKAGKVRSRRR